VTERLNVIIDGGVDADARGVGHRVDDPNVEVRVVGALPKETVTARLLHRSKKGRCFAVTESVEVAADDRVEVGCEHFGDCGGCDLLHASIDAQHGLKRQWVADALDAELERVDSVIASPLDRGYRAMAKMVPGPDGILGSYRPRTHDVVSMQGCVVHAPAVEQIIDAVRGWLAEGLQADLRYLLVRTSVAESRSVVTLVSRQPRDRGVLELGRKLAARDDVARVVLNVNDTDGDALLVPGADVVLHGTDAPTETIGAIQQSLESGAFVQVNPLAAAKLYERVVACAEPAGRPAIDLYSGSGGIAASLAKAGAEHVLAIEANAEACDAAARAAEAMDLPIEVLEGPVELGLLEVTEAELVVLNPPRKGATAAVLEQLAALAPLRLVYVSCNPQSLARDVALLGRVSNVEVRSITPVDMFPNTRHIETVWCADIAPA